MAHPSLRRWSRRACGNWSQVTRCRRSRFRPGANGRVTIVCDPSRLVFHPEGELLTSDHPLLDYIRDHLERDGSLRVVEIWLPPNLENLNGIVAVPDVEFHPHPATTAATVSWRPVAITTWAVAYDTDERMNFPLSLAHDLRSAQPMPNLLRAVSLNGLRDGRPPNVALPALEPVLAAGRRLAEERVRSDLAILSGEIETRMQADRARIEHHLASELASLRPNDSEGRGRLESLSKKEIEDLALKYHCTARLSLHDIACVWLPDITWKVKISGRTRSCVSEEFHWSLDRGLIAPDCERCHAPHTYTACIPQQHFHCVCTSARGPCSVCNEAGCEIHIDACIVGGELLCPDHHVACAGCEETVCATHSAPAYTRSGQRVCRRCLRNCANCPPDRAWLASDLRECVTCHQLTCQDHGAACGVCRQFSCLSHLRPAVDGTLLCERDRAECRHCPADANIHRRPLVRCAVCGGGTCREHAMKCAVCGVQSYSSTHHLPACQGCGRASCGQGRCSANGFHCVGCGLDYCLQCAADTRMVGQHTSKFGIPGPLCRTCLTLAPVVIDSNRLAWIDQVHAHLGGDEAALLGQMLQQRKYLKIYGGSNNATRVYALRAARPIWAMLTASIGDRVLWIRQDADRRLSAHVVPYRGGS